MEGLEYQIACRQKHTMIATLEDNDDDGGRRISTTTMSFPVVKDSIVAIYSRLPEARELQERAQHISPNCFMEAAKNAKPSSRRFHTLQHRGFWQWWENL